MTTYTYTGAIQTYTITTSDDYVITAYGAQGGASPYDSGGEGAEATGVVYLTAGTEVEILVGGAGGSGAAGAGGGGGGSYVVEVNGPTLTALVVGGGGGGAATFGADGSPGLGGVGSVGASGGGSPSGTFESGGGGGFVGDGGSTMVGGGGGASFSDGGAGGLSIGLGIGNGGFGGGGGAGFGGGGGGGYLGGGDTGGSGGGGGGSYVISSASGVTTSSGVETGNGLVTILGGNTPESMSGPANGTYRVGASLDFTVTFAEAMTVDTSGGTPRIAITLDTGGVVYANYISGGGTNALTFEYVVAAGVQDLTGIALATSIDLNGGAIADSANTAAILDLTGVEPSTAGIDVQGIAPVVSSIAAAGASPNHAGSDSYTVTFSEAVTGVNASDFVATTTGTVGDTGIVVTPVGASIYTVTVNGVTGDGTLRLDLNGSGTGIADLAGNAISGGFTNGDVYTIEHTPPSVASIAATGSSPNHAGSDSYTVTFSEAVTGVDASDFAAITTGTVGDTGIVVTPVSGSVYTVTVDGVTGDGTLRLNLNASGTGIADLAGNAISGGFTGGDVYHIDHTDPVVAFGAAAAIFNGVGPTTLAGTVSDHGSGVASVVLYNGAVKRSDEIGVATVAGGRWTFTTLFSGARALNHLLVVATDKAGNATTSKASFALNLGVAGKPYVAFENGFDGAGRLSWQKYFLASGAEYEQDRVTYFKSGAHEKTYSDFSDRPYVSSSVFFGADGAVDRRTYLYAGVKGGAVASYIRDVSPSGVTRFIVENNTDGSHTTLALSKSVTLQGHPGKDVFIFSDVASIVGNDVIDGFDRATDKIDVGKSTFAKFSALETAIKADPLDGAGATSTQIRLNTHDSILIAGVAPGQLKSADFNFI